MPSGPPPRVTEEGLSDLLLVALAFGAGAVDAISYLGLGRVFTANMTGNIVLLGVEIGRASGATVLRSAISLVAFIAGVLAATLIAGQPERNRLWPGGVKLTLAFEAATQAALLIGWLASSAHPATTLEAILVGASALAMGLQSGAVRALGVAGISTTYVTGTLTGLIGGVATGKGSRRDWARRGSVVAAVLVGAACAAVLVFDARRAAPALPLAVTVLVLGAAAYVLPRAAAGAPAQ
ncbi:MAG TPA: YoaK family protein [Solirubrobacteraceae bacterium]|nr:YoaK family protein [Solirubrobacteraceae bacterium]